jgi:hypothetical protein
VDVLRAQVALGIQQRHPLALDLPARVQQHDRDLDDPMPMGRQQAGRLGVDDRVHPGPPPAR